MLDKMVESGGEGKRQYEVWNMLYELWSVRYIQYQICGMGMRKLGWKLWQQKF